MSLSGIGKTCTNEAEKRVGYRQQIDEINGDFLRAMISGIKVVVDEGKERNYLLLYRLANRKSFDAVMVTNTLNTKNAMKIPRSLQR